LKFEYTAPVVYPASSAISSSDAPWNPRRRNTTSAASSSWVRVCSWRWVRVSLIAIWNSFVI
jgi:hypothetical protein